MIATLLSINLNGSLRANSGKTFTGVEVTYQGMPYKGKEKDPTTRFLFKDNPVAKKLEQFKVGDKVDISFDTDKFKTPLDIKLAEDTPTKAPTGGGGGGWSKPSDPNTEKRIARAVAIKEATTIVLSMADKEVFTKKNMASNEFLATTIVETAKYLEPYLTLSEGSDDVEYPNETPTDMDQETYDD